MVRAQSQESKLTDWVMKLRHVPLHTFNVFLTIFRLPSRTHDILWVIQSSLWLKNYTIILRILNRIGRLLKLYYGHKLTVIFSNKNRSIGKSKHIDTKFLIIKERIQSNQAFIEHIKTKSIVAELTNGLSLKVFHNHNAHIGIILHEGM